MSVYESSITNPKKQLEFYKYLSEQLQQENQQLKELKYKFFDASGDEESFTLEDYLDLINKVYDLERENQQLKERNENQFNDLMKRIHSNNDKHLEESNKLIKENFQLKKVIDEVRKYIKDNLFDDDNGCGCWWQQFGDYEDAKGELLQILDKVKGSEINE